MLLRALLLLLILAPSMSAQPAERPRARDMGVVVGILPTGPRNAITDVPGVRIGQVTVVEGDSVRTGVTAILPHGDNVFLERVPAALHVGNGFGKLLGVTQLRELGELETPILLTCTLCVWKAADALTAWMLARGGMADVRSINPVVGETNDGGLNDIRSRPIRPEHVVAALETASEGDVIEGSVGAGTGTIAFGWKGGIGTSARRLPGGLGGHTVGVLVQANFGGVLTINGAPVGRRLGRYLYSRDLPLSPDTTHAPRGDGGPYDGGPEDRADGSIMIVVATDAPLDARTLERLAARALVGLARTGASMTNGSGDYVLAFSTAEAVRRRPGQAPAPHAGVGNDAMTPLFQAVAEATEEAILNALFRATTVESRFGRAEALPLDRVRTILGESGVLRWDRTLPRPR
jgi:D-aminopeptidase